MKKTYQSKEEILEKANTIIDKSLRDVISKEAVKTVETSILKDGAKRKGYLGDITEKYFFEIEPGNKSEPDFQPANVELKTTPLKTHSEKKFASKERLIFSMINYINIKDETWDTSSFLKKNRTLLLMFYLWMQNQTILDYKFKFTQLLDLLVDIPKEDLIQIKNDWEFIVSKIKRGEAHLLSEADTCYLGACVKGSDSSVSRKQPASTERAKPRAFSLKQQYINYYIQTKLLGNKVKIDSISVRSKRPTTIQRLIKDKFEPYLGKTDRKILKILKYRLGKISKSYKRLIVNRILGVGSSNILELEKANITLRVVTLEHTGILRESISFPAFDYNDLINQVWEDEENGTLADFHMQLETQKFLFVIFQKQKGEKDIILRKIFFWNFPMKDLPEAKRVWEKTVDYIKQGKYLELPKISESNVAHVRPHGKNSREKIETPQKTLQIKRSFWLNAKYIQSVINNS